MTVYIFLFVWLVCCMCVWCVYYVFYVYMGQVPEIKLIITAFVEITPAVEQAVQQIHQRSK